MTNPRELPQFDFKIIRSDFDDLLAATINKLDREGPKALPGDLRAIVMLEALLRVTQNTYNSILSLASETSPDPFHKREFGLSVSPLARVLVEILFTLVFALDDVSPRTLWYHRAGWREVMERYELLSNQYGNDPDWRGWLAEYRQFIDNRRSFCGVTPAEAADLMLIEKWPLPGQMKNFSKLSSDRRVFIGYLYDWYYKEMSQDAHLSWSGLMRQSAALLPRGDTAARDWQLSKQISDSFFATEVLCLAIMSEIEITFQFGLFTRLRYVWGVIHGYWMPGKELYDKRYVTAL